jgi:hypothetical protein
MATSSHPTDHPAPELEAPGPEPAATPALEEPQPRRDGIRRLVVFIGRPRPQPA